MTDFPRLYRLPLILILVALILGGCWITDVTSTTLPGLTPESTPSLTNTPESSETPDLTPQATSPATPDGETHEFGGDSLIVAIGNEYQYAIPMIDPQAEPLGIVWTHVMPIGAAPYYTANPYYCRRNYSNGELIHADGSPEVPCKAPFNLAVNPVTEHDTGGDPNASLWRMEYTFGRCPPFDPDGGSCEPTAGFFCDSAPCDGGWQWRIYLNSLDVQAIPVPRTCQIRWDAYIWSPDPDWSRQNNYYLLSGALTADATEDDKRSVIMYASLGDNWMLRERAWSEEDIYAYPHNPVSDATGDGNGNQALPFDQWRSYSHTFDVPDSVVSGGDIVASIGFYSRWGWATNVYIRNVDLVCDGVYQTLASRATPTQVAGLGGGGDSIEVTPLGGGVSDSVPQTGLPPGTTYTPYADQRVYRIPSLDGSAVGVIAAGAEVPVENYVVLGVDTWACIRYDVTTTVCGWVPVNVQGESYGTTKYGLLVVGLSEDTSSTDDPDQGVGGGGFQVNIPFISSMPINVNLLVSLVVLFLTFVPVVGGSGGAFSAALLDLIKAILYAVGKPLPDNISGYIALVLNVLLFAGIFLVTGSSPGDILPEGLSNLFGLLTTVVIAAGSLITMIVVGRSTHNQLKIVAPVWFSTTAQSRLLVNKAARQ